MLVRPSARVTSSTATRSTRRSGTRSSARTTTKYVVEGGALKVTTVAGDIYSGRDTAVNTRNFLLQTADHAGADWVIETKLVGHDRAAATSRAACWPTATTATTSSSTLISDDGQTADQPDRAALGGRRHRPEPAAAVRTCPPGTTDIWLRLTKTGTSTRASTRSTAPTWTALAETVAERHGGAAVRPVHAGRQRPGGTVTFDYFSVDGEGGLPGRASPRTRAPVLGDRDGDADVRLRPAAGRLHGRGDRRRRGPADLQLGLRRRRHGGLVRAEPVAHLRHGGHVRRQGDGVRRRGRRRRRPCTVTVLAGRRPGRALPGARVLQDRRASGTTSIDEGIAAIKAARRRRTTSRSTPPRTRRVFRDGVLVAATTRWCSCRRPATRSTTRSRRRSSTTSRPAAATPASTPPPTPSTTWPWYGRLVGALLPQPPGERRTATVRIEDHGPPRPTEGLAGPLAATGRVVQLPVAGVRRRPGSADGDFSPRPNVHVLRRRRGDLRRGRRQRDAMTTIRSRGASATTAAGRGTRAWATPRLVRPRRRLPHAPPRRPGGQRPARWRTRRAASSRPATARSCRRSRIRAPGTAPLQVNFSATGIDPDGGEIAEYKLDVLRRRPFFGLERVAHVHDGGRVHRHRRGQGQRGCRDDEVGHGLGDRDRPRAGDRRGDRRPDVGSGAVGGAVPGGGRRSRR